MCRSILRECGGWGRRRRIREPGRRGSVRTRRGRIASVVWLSGWLSREHGARHKSWRGSRIGRRSEVGVKPIDRRRTSELASRWRSMVSRPIARVEPRGSRTHSIGRHLPDGGTLSGKRLDGCRWWSPTTLV